MKQFNHAWKAINMRKKKVQTKAHVKKESECAKKCVHKSVSDVRKMRDCEEDSQSYARLDESDFYGTSSSDECSVEINFEDWCDRR